MNDSSKLIQSSTQVLSSRHYSFRKVIDEGSKPSPNKPIRQSQVQLAQKGDTVPKSQSMKKRLERPRQRVQGQTTLMVKDGKVKAVGNEDVKSHTSDGWGLAESASMGMRAESAVIEYFESYIGDTLNEDTSNEDIADAVEHLILLTEAVLEATVLSTNIGT